MKQRGDTKLSQLHVWKFVSEGMKTRSNVWVANRCQQANITAFESCSQMLDRRSLEWCYFTWVTFNDCTFIPALLNWRRWGILNNREMPFGRQQSVERSSISRRNIITPRYCHVLYCVGSFWRTEHNDLWRGAIGNPPHWLKNKQLKSIVR